MGKWAKVRRRILEGQSDQNIVFNDMLGYLRHLGFEERIRGSHHIFTHSQVREILNLQPIKGDIAKGYQVKQVRSLLVFYHLGGADD